MVVSSRRRLSVEKCVIAERSLEARVRSNLKFEHSDNTRPSQARILGPRRLLSVSSGRGQRQRREERRERDSKRGSSLLVSCARMNKLILCVDLGSSSVRCSLYELVDDLVVEGNDGRAAVQVVDGLVTGLSWQAVHPHTGRLCLQQDDDRSLFAVVEACIDETLQKLATSTKSDGAIVAVGFSSLVMNLLGVDAAGQPVGEEATLTYACHSSAVAAKVQELQGYETRPFGDPLLWEALSLTLTHSTILSRYFVSLTSTPISQSTRSRWPARFVPSDRGTLARVLCPTPALHLLRSAS
jgi:hypothetical protein